MPSSNDQLRALVSHLASRRETILLKWRSAVQEDPELTAPQSLSRSQFRDHIPQVLIGFESSLLAGRDDAIEAAEEEGETGAEHGIHRWQQGYSLLELMREWGHLHRSLVDELELYIQQRPDVERAVIGVAHRTLAALFTEGINESTHEFVRMQQAEASSQVRDLAQALKQGRELQKVQADLLREATHDLRGQLGIVTSAAEVLDFDDLTPESRSEINKIFHVALTTQNELFNSLMDLARLQAGQERRETKTTNVAEVLQSLCDSAQSLAKERHLLLQTVGSATLEVECDPIRVRRIAQNLLLNAIKYTQQGSVTLRWGDSRSNDPQRWMLSIADTGPGFHAGPGGPLSSAIKEATEESNVLEPQAGKELAEDAEQDHRPDQQRTGEGIGLSIVKRLCELLDASLEMESEIDRGTVFRVIFPRQYSDN